MLSPMCVNKRAELGTGILSGSRMKKVRGAGPGHTKGRLRPQLGVRRAGGPWRTG